MNRSGGAPQEARGELRTDRQTVARVSCLQKRGGRPGAERCVLRAPPAAVTP